MRITWYGHAAFRIDCAGGIRVIMDPYSPASGYDAIDDWADLVTLSHDNEPVVVMALSLACSQIPSSRDCSRNSWPSQVMRGQMALVDVCLTPSTKPRSCMITRCA